MRFHKFPINRGMLFRNLVPVTGFDPRDLASSDLLKRDGPAQEPLQLLSQGITISRPDNEIVVDRQ